MDRLRIAAVVLPLAASSFTGCGNQKEIRIGGLATVSGPDAANSASSQHGFELAFAECNAAGGIHGRPVKLVVADDKSDDLGCTQAAQQLVAQDKVVAVLGPNLSWLARSGGKICQQAQVPMVATMATDPAVTQVGDYIFRACFTDKQQGEVGAKFAYDSLNARNAACLFMKFFNTPANQATADSFTAQFTSMGGKVATEFFGLGKDPSQVLDSVLATRPDLLYVAAPDDESAKVARQAREKGYKGPILGTDHFSAGDSRPEVKEFVKKYIGRFGVEPDARAVLAYDASRLLFDSLNRAGSTAGPAVRDALKAADFAGVSGRVKFDEARNPLKPVTILKVQAGKLAYSSTVNP